MIHALIFDLDDTLYSENDFVESGYKSVARHLSSRIGCDFNQLYGLMLDTLDSKSSHSAMNIVKEMYSEDSVSIVDMVWIYRRHNFAGIELK